MLKIKCLECQRTEQFTRIPVHLICICGKPLIWFGEKTSFYSATEFFVKPGKPKMEARVLKDNSMTCEKISYFENKYPTKSL